ncbi:MAG: hypothetical protein BJ554DRAFT_7397 [Olpidium bornovanus]|uniref:Polyprotein n=1 Tax=Olpidium bornovanus TaxID=278681 RepID=A0A8H7ZW53_9FUNG|nr:MAG: hypothetical protein BJ554DRAFT_7397 [Olpidium bornovanus]
MRKHIPGGLVHWKSAKQSCTTLSSSEAELVAASATTQEIIWLCQIVTILHSPQSATNIFVDHRAVIELASHVTHNFRTKHINVRRLFNRDRVTYGQISIIPITTTANVTDTFTKSPKAQIHCMCCFTRSRS